MPKSIDKLLFDAKLGVAYTQVEKLFTIIGLGMGVLGVVWMISNKSEVVFWQGATVAMAGMAIMQTYSAIARGRKIKQSILAKVEKKA